jgi:hypothetical protein
MGHGFGFGPEERKKEIGSTVTVSGESGMKTKRQCGKISDT